MSWISEYIEVVNIDGVNIQRKSSMYYGILSNYRIYFKDGKYTPYPLVGIWKMKNRK